MAQPSSFNSPTSLPSADWPVGYPCVAQQAFRDENIDMPAGARGKIDRSENGYAWVTLPFYQPPRSGRVPQSYLQIGTTRKYGDVHVVYHFSNPYPELSNPQAYHPPPNTMVKSSSIKSVGQMQAELQQLGLNAFGNPGQMDQPSRGTRRPANACDSCYLHNLEGRNFLSDGVRKLFALS